MRFFTSPLIAPQDGIDASFAHGLSGVPQFLRLVAVNIIADAGYTPGQELDVASFWSDDVAFPNFVFGADGTNVFVEVSGFYSNSGNQWWTRIPGNGSRELLGDDIANNWNLRLYAGYTCE